MNENDNSRIDRRKLLGTAGLIVAAGVTSSALTGCDRRENSKMQAPPPLSAPSLPQDLLVNRERASYIMKQSGVSAIICALPRNVYYLTNYFPQLSKMGLDGFAFAILTADEKVPPVLVEGQFGFYIAAAETQTAELVDVRLHTGFAEADLTRTAMDLKSQLGADAIPSFLPQIHGAYPLNSLESNKLERTNTMSESVYASSQIALINTLKDLSLDQASLAVDSFKTKALLEKADINNVRTNGEQLLRTIRLQKTSAEIALMRYAAQANADASLAAAKLVRQGASFQDIRQNYAVQCGQRLMTPDFMFIDNVAPEMARGEIKDGRSFLIDCVSHHQYYHGDYGRTVCVGQPTREIQRATTALAQIWDGLLPQLKPGLFYNEISDLAADIYAKTDTDAGLVCNPHSVGLNHTDEPSKDGADYFVKDNLQLMEGMVVSVDLPMIQPGFGGSAHLEDLVLITSDGAELINDGGDRLIIV